jgi:hypothetical protein
LCRYAPVLQAMVRAPTVSGFFLKDGHNREICAAERGQRAAAAADAGAAPAAEDEFCLVGLALFTTLFCSQNTVQLMTASIWHM